MGPTMTSERKKIGIDGFWSRRGAKCKVHVQPMCATVPVERKLTITNRHMSMR